MLGSLTRPRVLRFEMRKKVRVFLVAEPFVVIRVHVTVEVPLKEDLVRARGMRHTHATTLLLPYCGAVSD